MMVNDQNHAVESGRDAVPAPSGADDNPYGHRGVVTVPGAGEQDYGNLRLDLYMKFDAWREQDVYQFIPFGKTMVETQSKPEGNGGSEVYG